MKNMRKKSIALVAGLAITGIVGASAASLGPVTGSSLGATVDTVASCDTDGITVSYLTDYDLTEDAVLVTEVEIGSVATACNALDFEVTLTGGTPVAELGNYSGTVTLTANAFTIDTTGTAVDAEDVTGIAVVISTP